MANWPGLTSPRMSPAYATSIVSRSRPKNRYARDARSWLAHAAVRQHHILLEPARTDAHEGDAIAMARIHVRLNLEDKAGKAIVGRIDDTRIARSGRRRRRQVDQRLQKRLEAEVGKSASEKYRRLQAFEVLLHVEVRAGRSDDVERLSKMRVHVFTDHLAGFGVVDRGDIDRRAILPLRFALVEVQRLPLDVVHPSKLVGVADRPVHRCGGDTKRRLDVVHQRERIFGRTVELVDEGQNRKPVPMTDLVELARLRLDAVGRVDHHDDAVGGYQGAVGIFAEVLVAGCVEQRHAPALNLELERGRRDGNAALLFHLHPVRRRGTAILASAHGACELDGAPIEQQLLCQRRLAGVRVRDDGKGPSPRHLAIELALNRLVCLRRARV